MNKKIDHKNTLIQNLQQARAELQTNFAQALEKQLNVMPIPANIKIPFSLPAQYQYYDYGKTERVVELNGDEIKNILIAMTNDLKKNPLPLFGLQELLKEKVLFYVTKKLMSDWSFLPNDERELAINLKIKESDIPALLSDPILETLRKDPLLNDMVRNFYVMDYALARAEVEKNTYMAQRNALRHAKNLFENEYKAFKEQYPEQLTVASQNEVPSEQSIDENLLMQAKNLDNFEKHLILNEEISDQLSAEIDFIAGSADDLMAGLDELAVIEEIDDNQLELLEEKQLEMEEKWSVFNQLIKQEESVDFEMGNKPSSKL